MSQWLDGQPALISLVAGDLRRQGVRETGRRGLPAESVLRCALLKQQRQLSYEELAFHLEDSASLRAFARLPLGWSPKKSVLHQTIGTLRAETWEAVNQALLASAKQDRLESGATVRLDSTVSAALMHEPSDSTLLWDAVRVMTRLLRRAQTLPGAPAVEWRDRRRLAKKRARAIEYSRGSDNKRRLYGELIAAARASRAELQALAAELAEIAGTAAKRWCAQVDHYLPLIARIIAQSERRVLNGEAVSAGEKLVSLFEPHADIIVRGRRAACQRRLVTAHVEIGCSRSGAPLMSPRRERPELMMEFFHKLRIDLKAKQSIAVGKLHSRSDGINGQAQLTRVSGGSAIFSSCLPKFSPMNNRRNVCGAFSRPTATSSFCLSLPSASQPARASIASENRAS